MVGISPNKPMMHGMPQITEILKRYLYFSFSEFRQTPGLPHGRYDDRAKSAESSLRRRSIVCGNNNILLTGVLLASQISIDFRSEAALDNQYNEENHKCEYNCSWCSPNKNNHMLKVRNSSALIRMLANLNERSPTAGQKTTTQESRTVVCEKTVKVKNSSTSKSGISCKVP